MVSLLEIFSKRVSVGIDADQFQTIIATSLLGKNNKSKHRRLKRREIVLHPPGKCRSRVAETLGAA